MTTLETLSIVFAVYAVVFLAHRCAGRAAGGRHASRATSAREGSERREGGAAAAMVPWRRAP